MFTQNTLNVWCEFGKKSIFGLDAKSKLLHKNMSGAYRMCIKSHRTSRRTFDTIFAKIVGNGKIF